MANLAVQQFDSSSDEHENLVNPMADDVMQSTESISINDDNNNTQDNTNIVSDDTLDHAMESTQEVDMDAKDVNMGELFGSDLEDEGSARGKARKLDGEEPGSGDDENRIERMEDDEMDGYDDEEMETAERTILDVGLGRHGVPLPSNGELCLLKFPKHLGIEPKNFRPEDFQPPTTDHHSSGSPSTTFSARETARNTLRWRHSPRDPKLFQSNAKINVWEDGSVTLQLATDAHNQYSLVSKPLAPPKYDRLNRNPDQTSNTAIPYDASLDTQTYLTSPHEGESFLRITNHITSSLTVQSTTTDIKDDKATANLQAGLAAAKKTGGDGGVAIITVTEDPELAKKKAELAERDKIRAQRRRQNQEEKERDRANRVLGRSGHRTGGIGGGLTVGGLEDDDGMAGATRPRAQKPSRKPKRRNSEYSDDEEDYRNRGRTKEDEYDEDDGFLVGSDEEPEIVVDEGEDVELPDEGDEDVVETKVKKGKKEKGGNDDAARAKKRRVVVEDEEED